jgi:hypothetical protein
MLVPADEDEGAGGDVHYVTKVRKFVCLLVLTKASPGLIINPCVYFQVTELIIAILCAFTFRS